MRYLFVVAIGTLHNAFADIFDGQLASKIFFPTTKIILRDTWHLWVCVCVLTLMSSAALASTRQAVEQRRSCISTTLFVPTGDLCSWRSVLLGCVLSLDPSICAVVGAGFMVLMCLGALACCIHKGPQAPEDNILVSEGKGREWKGREGKGVEYTYTTGIYRRQGEVFGLEGGPSRRRVVSCVRFRHFLRQCLVDP